MTFTKPDTAYWERKFIAYMHDPLDKIFRIRGHGERSALFLDKYGLQKPNEDFWKRADVIAAGFERGQVPSYSADSNRNGAVNFLKNPIITHPTSEKAQLRISMPAARGKTLEYINEKLLEFIEKEIGMKPGQGGYSDQFKGDEYQFAVARFLYTHLILRFKLAENNVGGLGAFWHRVPADSRFPDHSIWQHNALCSAICSCIELAENDSEIGMMVFSITPVQQFISKARKLRDYWTGSVVLSWLAFEGMRWVIENLGPDHILYPSLIDQPLVNVVKHLLEDVNRPDDSVRTYRLGDADCKVARSRADVRHAVALLKRERRHHLVRFLELISLRAFQHGKVALDPDASNNLPEPLLSPDALECFVVSQVLDVPIILLTVLVDRQIALGVMGEAYAAHVADFVDRVVPARDAIVGVPVAFLGEIPVPLVDAAAIPVDQAVLVVVAEIVLEVRDSMWP